PYGQGAVEGKVASESSNNACIGGALIPMLTLGVPGDAVTSVILSAFYVHGLRPGPLLFSETPEIFTIILAGGFIGSIMILILGLTVGPLMANIIKVKERHLFPIIGVLCIIGAYAADTSTFDVLLMLIFGVLGLIMRIGGYQVAPMVLGLVLGAIMDTSFRGALSLLFDSKNGLSDLLLKTITIVLIIMIIISISSNFVSIERE